MPLPVSPVSDQEIVDAYKKTLSYSKTAEIVGLSKQRIYVRINKLRSLGWDLPHPRCQVIDCTGYHYALDMCRKHHVKYLRHGHPLAEYKYVKPSADWRKSNGDQI